MSRYINADEIKTILQEVEAPDCSLIELLGALKEIATILEMPFADVRENKHGEWICVSTTNTWYEQWACNQCSGIMNVKTNFCPSCGADMRGETE